MAKAKKAPSSGEQSAQRRTPFRKRHRKMLRILGISILSVVLLAVVGAVVEWKLVCVGSRCPSVDALETYSPMQTSTLYAADGRFIAEIGAERRTLIRLNDVPKIVQDAFVVTEDKRFYQHSGIDWWRAIGAAFRNLRAMRYAQGFST